KVQNALITEAIIQKKLAAAAGITLSNAEAMAAARTTLLSAAQYKLVAALKAVKAAMLSNPWTAALVGITAVVSAIVWFRDRTEDATEEVTGLKKAIADANAEFDKEASKVKALQSIVENGNVAYAERKKALDELKGIIPGYHADLTTEGILIDNNTSAIKEYLVQLEKQIKMKAVQEELEEAYRQKRLLENEQKDLTSEAQDLTGQIKDAHGYNKMAGRKVGRLTEEYVEVEAKIRVNQESINDVNSVIEELTKEIETSSLLTVSTPNESEDQILPNYSASYKKAEEEWNAAKKSYKAIKDDKLATVEEFEAASKRLEDAEKAFQALGGTTKETKGSGTEQSEIERRNKELLTLQNQNRQAEIDLMAEGSDKKIAQIKLNYTKEIAEIVAQEEKWKAAQGGNLTDDQTSEIEKAKQAADGKYNQSSNEILQDELKAYQEYLKTFGTYQQQKYAVVQEYEEKIRNAQTDWEKVSLQSELDQYNANLETQSLKMNIDWATVFGEFGGMFNSMIEPALKDAKEYLKTDDFKNADEASKQALISAISQMEDALGGSGTLSFKQLGADVQNYQDSLAQLNEAKEEEIELLKQLKEAYEAYQSALKDGTQEEIDIAKTNYDNAQTNANAASENVQSLTTTTNNFKQQVSDTASTLKTNMESVTDSISQIASGSLSSAYEGITNLIKQFSSASSTAGELAEQLDIPIISWILGLLDALQDGLGTLISGLLDSIFNAVTGILDDILSGQLFVSIGESIASGIVNIVKSIVTLGGALTWWGTDSNPDLEDTISDLMDSNDRLGAKIDALADKMSDVATADATSVYEEQLALLQAQEANYQQMMSESGSAWTNWGYGFLNMGGKSSSNKYINEGMSSSDWSRISEIVGRDINSASDWWGLSSEEMASVYNDAYDLYDKIKGLANDGHEDAAQYMDDYVALYEQIEEYKEALQEKLTGISFDSVTDNFKSALLEMDSDSETFTDNLSSMLQTAIVDSMMATTYSDMLKSWYEDFADSMSDGIMSDAEKQALEDSYNDIVNSALAELDIYKDLFGWGDSSTTQSGNSGSFETMSQDQGTKLEGLFTAAEIHLDSIDDNVVEMKDDIEEVSIQMSNATGYLKTIAENTTESKTTLADLYTTFKKMISDGLKIK
ncbi:MAG: hypothetical protein SNJ29_14595, partial [Rikenellaceae bacterium]